MSQIIPFPESGDCLAQLRNQAAKVKNKTDRALAVKLCAMFDQLRREAESAGFDVEIRAKAPAIIVPFPHSGDEGLSREYPVAGLQR